jgi:FAD-dependent urate hydroxylase
MSDENVLIIGAGPFGLSISAHLRALGLAHRIVGKTMDTWEAHMPVGMNLKSEPYASGIAAPSGRYDVAEYCRQQGLPYVNRVGPVSLERFTGYAAWYASQLVPDIADVSATLVNQTGDGFEVAFAETESLTARSVVVATGVLPHAYVPAELAGLPSDLVSHSADHRDLAMFSGRDVAVVGAGQSALETAALLHEAGANATLIVRRPKIAWVDPNPEQISGLGHIRRPTTKLCEGWHCAVWNSPDAFRLLPKDVRVTKARTVLGPAGAAWLKNRVEGVVDVLAGCQVVKAEPVGSRVRLELDGERPALEVDHVIAGTGFRINVANLGFLPDQLRAKVATLNGFPVLSRACESSVAGLYFVGAAAAVSLGPSQRFLAGTHNSVRQLTKSLARRQAAAGAETADRRITATPLTLLCMRALHHMCDLPAQQPDTERGGCFGPEDAALCRAAAQGHLRRSLPARAGHRYRFHADQTAAAGQQGARGDSWHPLHPDPGGHRRQRSCAAQRGPAPASDRPAGVAAAPGQGHHRHLDRAGHHRAR